uniref:Amidase domain-containing protein n=1 Tax=Parastrongyloides trichosuri TaxID=131310 RepID=A0A0N4ZED9_PARTI
MSVNDFATRNTTSSQEAAEAAIARYEQAEELIQAFAHLDKEQVRRVAKEQENNTGPLKGLVIGIKDLINTADAPATYGSPIYRDNRPTQDAAIVQALRAAGAPAQNPQPLESGAHARWLLIRLGRCRSRQCGAGGLGHPDSGVRGTPRHLLRNLWLQTQLRRLAQQRLENHQPVFGYRGNLGPAPGRCAPRFQCTAQHAGSIASPAASPFAPELFAHALVGGYCRGSA